VPKDGTVSSSPHSQFAQEGEERKPHKKKVRVDVQIARIEEGNVVVRFLGSVFVLLCVGGANGAKEIAPDSKKVLLKEVKVMLEELQITHLRLFVLHFTTAITKTNKTNKQINKQIKCFFPQFVFLVLV
jgi:hypothetical protein